MTIHGEKLSTEAESDLDPTRMRNQPALTTSNGLGWLILGGLLAATAIALLVPMIALSSPAVATTGVALIVSLYAVMLIARFVARPGRMRLAIMAGAMFAIAVVALVCIGAITATEWNIVR